MIKLFSTTPLSLMLQLPLPTMLPPNPLDWQFPTTHIHCEIAINIPKLLPTPTPTPQKIWKLMIKLLSNTPLPPTLFQLFNQRLLHNILIWKSPSTHIHSEIVILMPPPPLSTPPRKTQKLKWMIKLLSTIPLPPKLHPTPLTTILTKYLARQSPTPYIHW